MVSPFAIHFYQSMFFAVYCTPKLSLYSPQSYLNNLFGFKISYNCEYRLLFSVQKHILSFAKHHLTPSLDKKLHVDDQINVAAIVFS